MDIAALSMGLSQMKIAQKVSISVVKIAMDNAEGQMTDLTRMMEQSVNPAVGSNIDLSV